MASAMMDWLLKTALLLLVSIVMASVASTVDMVPILPADCRYHHVPRMEINTALLTVHNDESMHKRLILYTQSKECYKCDLQPISTIRRVCSFRVDSRWPLRVEVRLYDNGTIHEPSPSCSEGNLTQLYQEGGNYSIYIQFGNTEEGSEKIMCISALTNDPDDPNIPIYVAIGLFCCLIIVSNNCYRVYRKGYIHRFICFWSTESMMSDLSPPNNINHLDDGTVSAETPTPPVKERLKSLDTFRGFSIVIMIFVNYGGGGYWFFKHSKWNGLTVADLVFPWFVFIMGTAMVYSIRSQVMRNVPKWRIFTRIVRRSATLFFLGLIINSSSNDGVDLSTFRIPGVLQRFAGTYLITSSFYLFFSIQHAPNQYSRLSVVQDVTDSALEWVAQLTMVAVQLAVTFCLPVPDCPSGYLGPGGLAEGGKYFNCVGGAAGLIDRKFFGEEHIYQHPTSTEIYHQSLPYDPEGLLGTLNSCFICFLGLQAGKIIVMHKDWVQRVVRFFIWAVVLGTVGTILCKASLNDGWIPINKNLWSLSFVLILAGMGFFLLMICYILIDVYKVWSGSPFYYAGMNAIALYIGHEFFSGRFPVSFAVRDTHAAQLSLNLWGAAFWVLISVYLHYREIFISV